MKIRDILLTVLAFLAMGAATPAFAQDGDDDSPPVMSEEDETEEEYEEEIEEEEEQEEEDVADGVDEGGETGIGEYDYHGPMNQ